MPPDPSAVDAPTPFARQGALYVLVRAWSAGTAEWYSRVQHVFRYDLELTETSRCLRDLAPALEGESLSLS